jgi:hypothetical protein
LRKSEIGFSILVFQFFLFKIGCRREMGSESETFFQLEIAHVLFTDIAGYSKLPNAKSEVGSQRSEVGN